MVNEPLNNHHLEHYLFFMSDAEDLLPLDNPSGLIRIDEPQGFDGANLVIKQGSKRYGRDVSFAGGEVDFVFTNTCAIYGHEFEKIVDYDKRHGYESEVQYLLKIKDETDYFVVGELDFELGENDQIREFRCKVIQETSSALLKRRINTKVDVFSDTDLDDNAINPVETESILLKAKPQILSSKWFAPQTFTVADTFQNGNTLYFNAINGIEKSEINASLSYLPSLSDTPEDFKYIEANADLTETTLTITDISAGIPQGGNTLQLCYRYGATVNTATEVVIDTYNITVDNESYSITIPPIINGHTLWIYFKYNATGIVTIASVLSGEIEIDTTSTAIDSVTKGVRLYDAMNQVSSSINPEFVFNAPRFDLGGEWYDNYVFSGNMLRGRKDDEGNNVPFVISWKEITSALQEFNADYEINEKNLFVGKYDDYYTNTEIASFLINPNDSFNLSYNDRYSINEFKFGYKKFDQEKDDSNTIDGVHTEAEFLNKNKKVENKKDIKCEFNRDPFLQESTRIKAVQENSTSVTEDDQIFINDVVPLSPSAMGGFTASLTHFTDSEGNLKLLNNGSFNWQLLGFDLGTQFTINPTLSNQGQYTVLDFSNNIITLQPNGFTPTGTGVKLTSVSYPYTNVAYTIRTNEGFDSITGIGAPDKFANLLYTPKRNILNNWGSYLRTSSLYAQEDIKLTYFKNNPTLVTQFNGGDIIEENKAITQSELPEPILTPRVVTTTVICDFLEYKTFRDNLRTQRGFIRVTDNEFRVRKIYAKESDFTWADNLMEIVGEEKWESEITTVNRNGSVIEINETGYDQDVISSIEYSAEGNHVQIFDLATRPLINKTRYDYVSVNGVIYDNVLDLVTALENI